MRAMATTTARPSEQIGGISRARDLAGNVVSRPPWVLGIALAAAVAYAAFDSGAIDLHPGSRLQVGIAAIALGTLASLLFGRGLGVRAERGAALGFGLLVAFAAWAGLSIAWSIAPDQSWVQVNRAIAYASCAGLAMVLGSSLPNPARKVGAGYLIVAVAVALYALGGKVAPWLSIPGVIDLNQTELISRLRAPLDYWNALALFCVLAVPIALGFAADVEGSRRSRTLSALALVPLLCTIGLTYSRGGLVALALALAVLMALRPDPARIAALFLLGVLSVVPAYLVVVFSSSLTTDGLSVSDRSGAGVVMGLALLVGVGFMLFSGARLIRAGDAVRLGSRARAAAPRVAVGAVALGLVVLVVGLAVSGRGFTGEIDHQAHQFTTAKEEKQNEPGRLVNTNSGNRWVWWNEAVGAWSDKPLIGHGAGSFPFLHRQYRHDRLGVLQPHSVPLEFLAEEGLIGTVLVLGGLAMLALAGVRRYRRLLTPEQMAAAPLLAGVVAWGLHMWVDWDWDIPAVTLPLLVFLGVLAARPRGTAPIKGHEARSWGGRSALIGAGAVVMFLFVLSAVFPALADTWTNDAYADAAKGGSANLEEAARKAAAAKRLNPFDVEPVFAAASIARQRGQGALTGRLYADAVRRQPDNPDAWTRVASFQFAAADEPAGLRSALNALRLDPLAVSNFFLAIAVAGTPYSSATATGTPLPSNPFRPTAPKPAPVPKPAAPRRRRGGGTTAPRTTTPPARQRTPAPAPTPTPAPQTPSKPAPKPNNEGQPFKLDG
jgi:O-antigen ligase